MITVRGTLNLTDVGAHERSYEGINADVEITFTKGQIFLANVIIPAEFSAYIKSLGSTREHWINIIKDEFDNNGDYVLDSIIENLPEIEYAKAETYITAYYQDNPMPDGDSVELVTKPQVAWRPWQ